MGKYKHGKQTTPKNFEDFQKIMNKEKFVKPSHKSFLAFLYWTGVRQSEALERIKEDFKKEGAAAESILYLADNAGEIVFDKILIEQLGPEKIKLAVKGGPVINDATIEDVEETGLTDLVRVISNGNDAPGTILGLCSEEFRHSFEEADLIIAKGQGNYESLSDFDKNIFFLLKAKCPVVANHLGCEVGSTVLHSQNNIYSEGITNVILRTLYLKQ